MNATEQFMQRYETDLRFRMIAMSAVAQAMRDHGRIDPERADSDAHDVALRAVVIALGTAFEGDAELKAAMIERDQYKKIAENSLRMQPLRLVLERPAKEKEA